MALSFGAASDRVDLAAGLDNQHAFTVLAWIYKTGDTDGARIWGKGTGNIKTFFLQFGAGGNDFGLFVTRATTSADSASVTGVLPLNEWLCVAGTYDETDGPRIFKGSLTETIAEVSYLTRVVGAGASADDSGFPHQIGNRQTNDRNFPGRIARLAHFRRRLTLPEIIAWQFLPFVDADTDIYLELGYNPTGTQPNLTSLGTGINGTVTGATVADHVPLPPPMQPTFPGIRQLASVTASAGIAYEALTKAAAPTTTPLEALAGRASNANEAWESLALRAPTVAAVYEALAAATATRDGPWEAPASRSATATEPWEALAQVPQSAGLPHESLVSRVLAAATVYEALLGLATGASEPYEANAARVAQAAGPWETFGFRSSSAGMPFESLAARAAALTAAWETLAARAAATPGPLEAPAGRSSSSTSPWETFGQVTRSSAVAWEATAVRQALGPAPLEALAQRIALAVAPAEAFQAATTTLVIPLESLAGRTAIGVLPLEADGSFPTVIVLRGFDPLRPPRPQGLGRRPAGFDPPRPIRKGS